MTRPVPAPGPAPAVQRRALALLAVGLAANAVGHSFALIILPPLGRQMGVGDMRTGLLVGLSALVLTLSGPAWGWVCERWGRRPVLLTGLGAAMLFAAAFAAIVHGRMSAGLEAGTAFALLLAARLSQAVLSGGLMPAAQAYLADSTTAERRAGGMGLMGAAFGIGTIVGGALAWRLGGQSAVAALAAIAAVLALALVLLARMLPEPARSPGAAGQVGLQWGRLWPFLLITLLGLAAYSLLQQVTALRLQDAFGLSAEDSIRRSGAIMTLTMVMMIVTQGLVVRRLGWAPRRLLRAGAAGAVLCMAAALLAPGVPVLMAAMAGLGATLGLLIPGNLAGLSLRSGAGAQAKAAGLNAIGQGLGLAAGPVMGAALHQFSPAAPYVAGLALLGALCVLAFWRGLFAE